VNIIKKLGREVSVDTRPPLENALRSAGFHNSHIVLTSRNFPYPGYYGFGEYKIPIQVGFMDDLFSAEEVMVACRQACVRPATLWEFAAFFKDNLSILGDAQVATLRSPGGLYQRDYVVARRVYDRLHGWQYIVTLVQPGPDFFLDTRLLLAPHHTQ